MKQASQYRALASLCRQQAAYNPAQGWHLLSQAERWEHLAQAEIVSHFRGRTADMVYGTESVATPNTDGSPWKAIDAA